jgi:hypothetical protein
MLPAAYGLPAAILILLGGTLACFAGYRLFRIVLGITGFIVGAMMASSIFGSGSSMAMLIAALAGGLVGSIVLVLAYFVGIALIGAGLGALLGTAVWSWISPADPPVIAIIVVSIAGSIGAMMLQRYVIIAGTALGGAWMMAAGFGNVMSTYGAKPGASDVWIFYPSTLPGGVWPAVALAVVGLAVQLGMTGKKK